MIIDLGPEFLAIAREIVAAARSDSEWAEVESSDMYQSESFAGGYEAEEAAFCFSYYAPDGSEYWFQLTLLEIGAAARGALTQVLARPADD